MKDRIEEYMHRKSLGLENFETADELLEDVLPELSDFDKIEDLENDIRNHEEREEELNEEISNLESTIESFYETLSARQKEKMKKHFKGVLML